MSDVLRIRAPNLGDLKDSVENRAAGTTGRTACERLEGSRIPAAFFVEILFMWENEESATGSSFDCIGFEASDGRAP